LGTTLKTTFSPLSFGKSFMKIRSAVPENGCLIFCGGRKTTTKEQTVKHMHSRHLAARMHKLSSYFSTPLVFCHCCCCCYPCVIIITITIIMYHHCYMVMHRTNNWTAVCIRTTKQHNRIRTCHSVIIMYITIHSHTRFLFTQTIFRRLQVKPVPKSKLSVIVVAVLVTIRMLFLSPNQQR